MAATFRAMGPRDRELIRFDEDGEVIQLSLHSSVFRLRDREHTLVSIYDIGSDLDDSAPSWRLHLRTLRTLTVFHLRF